jgi:hypothetical protein
VNRRAKFAVNLILGWLNPQHFHFTVELSDDVTRQHREWKRMGGGAHPINGLKRNWLNGTGHFVQMGGINEQNELRSKGAQLARLIFRCGSAFKDQEVRRAVEACLR